MYRQWFLLLNHFLVVTCVSLNRRFDAEVYRHIELFKTRMLAELGLTTVPSLKHLNTTADEMRRMLDLYHQKLKEDELEEQRIRHMSLLEYTSLTATVNRSDERSQRTFYFILPSFSAETKSLHSATLRFSNYPNSTGLLKVFQVTSSGDHLVSEISLSDSNEWELFDLSRVVRQWIKDPSSNHGVRVECNQCEGLFSNQATLELLVRNRGHRIKRSIDIRDRKRKHKSTDCVQGVKTGCCRKSFTVSFKDIGWNWVIKPETFNAHLCRGSCFKGDLLIDTHAVIKHALWKKSGGKRSLRLCCVPKKTKDLRVLHYGNQNPPQIEMRKIKKAIVKRCGCA